MGDRKPTAAAVAIVHRARTTDGNREKFVYPDVEIMLAVDDLAAQRCADLIVTFRKIAELLDGAEDKRPSAENAIMALHAARAAVLHAEDGS